MEENNKTSRKIYLIFTTNISSVGGIQYYITGKTKHLESIGWDVYVFFGAIGKISHCKIPFLDKYIEGRFCELIRPPYFYKKYFRDRLYKKIHKQIGLVSDKDRIVIESHDDISSMWAEIIASRFRGKHFLFLCNERFRGPDKYYSDFLDFYDFKHKRKEIAGEVEDAIQKLFGEYKTVSSDENIIFLLDEDPVHDIDNELVNNICKADWNICYIGRALKGYVPNIIRGVSTFSNRHPEKKVQFIIVGNADSRRDILNEVHMKSKNLQITELGDLVPIPKSIFKKVDVVIAGSGSARCAVYEGVPTILADSETFMANGLLGYDTKDFLYHAENLIQDTFDNQLERVLIEKIHKKMKFDFIPKNNPSLCTEQNLELINKSEMSIDYYQEELLCPSQRTQTKEVLFLFANDWLSSKFPRLKVIIKHILKINY